MRPPSRRTNCCKRHLPAGLIWRRLAEECTSSHLLVKSARRSLLPRFDFRAAAYDYGANSPVAFGAIIGEILPQLNVPAPSVSHWQGDWVVGGRVTFPLFDGGRRRGEIIAAQAQRQQAESAVLRTRLAITREVRTSLANLAGDQERVKALEASVTQAQEALRLERLKYQAGRSEINFVLDAEAALLTNDSLLREARRAMQIDRLALDLSLGSIAENSLRTPNVPCPMIFARRGPKRSRLCASTRGEHSRKEGPARGEALMVGITRRDCRRECRWKDLLGRRGRAWQSEWRGLPTLEPSPWLRSSCRGRCRSSQSRVSEDSR